jgi:hypothetical protein
MNLFVETNYPKAVPLEYKGLQLLKRYHYGEKVIDGFSPGRTKEQCLEMARSLMDKRMWDLDRFEVIEDAWRESIELESQRRTEQEQGKLDQYWDLFDKALDGDGTAAYLLKSITLAFPDGAPKERKAKPVRAGVGAGFLRFLSKCRHCCTDMAVETRASKYCSPACHKAAKAAKQQRFNKARLKVEHTPKACEHCHELFTPKRTDARFCATRCRVAHSRSKQNSVNE